MHNLLSQVLIIYICCDLIKMPSRRFSTSTLYKDEPGSLEVFRCKNLVSAAPIEQWDLYCEQWVRR